MFQSYRPGETNNWPNPILLQLCHSRITEMLTTLLAEYDRMHILGLVSMAGRQHGFCARQ